MITQRTKDALAVAKRRGVRLGGSKLEVAQEVSRRRRKALADRRAANVVPIIRDVQRAGLKELARHRRGAQRSRVCARRAAAPGTLRP